VSIWRELVVYARVIAVGFEITFKTMINPMFLIFAILIQPMILALLALWMLPDAAETQAISVVVGAGLTGLWSIILFYSSGSLGFERRNRTLEPLAAAPTPLAVILFAKNLAYVAQWLASTVFAYGVISLALGHPLRIAQPGFFAISLALTLLAFVTFGLILGTAFLLNPELLRWRNGMEYPVYLLGGFLFPIALLPAWTTPLSYALAPYWAARILHASAIGAATWSEALLCWGLLLAFSAASVIASAWLFRRVLYKVRVDATLGQY